jgi:hypothetical protein
MMGLFDWLAGLFSRKPEETPADVADRIERVADRFGHAGDDAAAGAARAAAEQARRAPSADAARRVEAEFLRSRGLCPDGRPLKPALGRGPGDTAYVRYGTTLRTGGSRAWRYNNPGYVRCSSRSTYYGALGCDGEFAIFPDYWTGVTALRLSLCDEYPDHTVRDALRLHLPPKAGADPDCICDEAGLDAAAKVEDLTDTDCRAIAPALESQPGWAAGEQFDRGAADSPAWVETAWNSNAVADAASADAAGADAVASDKATPTDNS